MPKLKPATHAARRAHILDAAEICFAAAGFHGTSMLDICTRAGVSAGAVYVYFKSKEDLIAGIADRDRAKITAQLKEMAEAPDLLSALARLGEHYAIEEPHYKRVLCIEIGAESTRNPAVGEIFRTVDSACKQQFEELFRRAAEEGRIAPSVDPETLARIIAVIGDGLFWRRAIDPTFDAASVLPALILLIGSIVNPVAGPATTGVGAKEPTS